MGTEKRPKIALFSLYLLNMYENSGRGHGSPLPTPMCRRVAYSLNIDLDARIYEHIDIIQRVKAFFPL